MKLNIQGLEKEREWEGAGVKLPVYDYQKVWKETKENPIWIHFGAGNIFRGYIANLQQTLLENGLSDKGIIASDTFDYDIINQIYEPFDNLCLLVSLNTNGSIEKNIIASIAESVCADSSRQENIGRLNEIFKNPSLQMASFTITEKGYALIDLDGNYLPIVMQDMKDRPEKSRHVMAMITALLLKRYHKAHGAPIALVSMDNCSRNGEKLQKAVFTIAKEWEKQGYVDGGFIEYIKDENKVSFPWTMIDKITPRPNKKIEKSLKDLGIEGMKAIVTRKNTFIAPFVNAEVSQYLVIEDKFPNGRPRLEKAGVYFTDRDTVNLTERMKVTTCLNPLHTALAVFGCLLGYNKIADEMLDEDLKRLVELIGYQEGMPVVTDPGIINPEDFIHEVIEMRLPNPFIPDTPQRIATDTSQKVAIRFGETIKSYVESKELKVESLIGIPLAIAGWLRYLLAVDDQGNEMELSSDPMLEELTKELKNIRVGKVETYQGELIKILENERIFGLNLMDSGIGEIIETMFLSMIVGKGAVRETIKKYK